MSKIKIRFNTKYTEAHSEDLKWRVLIDDTEYLASSIFIEVPSYTSQDVLPTGELKWHITCSGFPCWKGTQVIIKVKSEA